MRDEIVSASRLVVPVHFSTLRSVVEHVASEAFSSCFHIKIPLVFIHGVDQSRDYFVQEFEAMSIAGYQLNRVQNYYYLSEERLAKRWMGKSSSFGLDELDRERGHRRTRSTDSRLGSGLGLVSGMASLESSIDDMRVND